MVCSHTLQKFKYFHFYMIRTSRWEQKNVCNVLALSSCSFKFRHQGWEAQPHVHLNASFKSINIC